MSKDKIKFPPPKKIIPKRVSKADLIQAVNRSKKQDMIAINDLTDQKLFWSKISTALKLQKTVIILE